MKKFIFNFHIYNYIYGQIHYFSMNVGDQFGRRFFNEITSEIKMISKILYRFD